MVRYLPGQAVDSIKTGDRVLSEELHKTFLFCDIVDFSGICGSLSGPQVVRVVNTFFDAMVRALLDESAMLGALPEVHQKTGLDLQMRIGINLRVVVVGELGSVHHRVDYTVIGDPVNVAQRLEAQAAYDSRCDRCWFGPESIAWPGGARVCGKFI